MESKLSHVPGYIKSSDHLAQLVGSKNGEKLAAGFACLHDLAKSDDAGILRIAPRISRNQLSQLRAAFALSSALFQESSPVDITIQGPKDIANLVRERLRLEACERMLLINLNTSFRVISVEDVAVGSYYSVPGGAKEVFARAMNAGSSYIVLVHNHPSGNPMPSKQDIFSTTKLVEAGRILDLPLIDHVIMSTPAAANDVDFRSMKELKAVDFSI